MSGGGGELVHRDVLLFHGTENFGFGNVSSGVNIQQISRGTMGLVAREASVSMTPVRPAFDVGEVQIRNGFAAIALDASDCIFRTFAEQGRQLCAKIVASACLKFL